MTQLRPFFNSNPQGKECSTLCTVYYRFLCSWRSTCCVNYTKKTLLSTGISLACMTFFFFFLNYVRDIIFGTTLCHNSSHGKLWLVRVFPHDPLTYSYQSQFVMWHKITSKVVHLTYIYIYIYFFFFWEQNLCRLIGTLLKGWD